MKTNKERHALHRMPENATLEQRIAWRIEHQKNAPAKKFHKKLKKK